MITFVRLFGFFTNPIVLIIAAAAALGGYILYQRHDAVVEERARVEEIKTNDIKTATKARKRVRTACERDRTRCVPDKWYRD
jgi:hypothetical protein